MGQERSEAQGLIVKMDMIRADFCLVPQDARLNQHNQSGTVSSCSRKCPNSLLYRQSSPCDVVNGPGDHWQEKIHPTPDQPCPTAWEHRAYLQGRHRVYARAIFVTSLTCEGRGRMVHTIIRLFARLATSKQPCPDNTCHTEDQSVSDEHHTSPLDQHPD
jgi:hypothetical protein